MKKFKSKHLRIITIHVFLVLVIVGLVTNVALGTLSSFGIGAISLICPLGAIEAWLASRTFIPLALTSLLCVIILGALFGKAFCAWICPAPLWQKLRSIFQVKVDPPDPSGASRDESGGPLSSQVDSTSSKAATKNKSQGLAKIAPSVFHGKGLTRPKLDSRFAVLLGAIASTAVFGFPVFCLVCPIGLTFASVIALWRLIGFHEPTGLLLVAPLMIVLELVVFRKWCSKICPLGALMSLAASLNKVFRPKVDEQKCLRTAKGVDCHNCRNACSEEIDLHNAPESRPLSECTKCRDCAESCPVSAIRFPGFDKKEQKVREPSVSTSPDAVNEGCPAEGPLT